jgi:hypothetical protein
MMMDRVMVMVELEGGAFHLFKEAYPQSREFCKFEYWNLGRCSILRSVNACSGLATADPCSADHDSGFARFKTF